MLSSPVEFAVEEAFANLKRNQSMNWASFLTVTVTLCILGFALMVSANLNHLADQWSKEAGLVVFFSSNATTAQEEAVSKLLEGRPEVRNVRFVSKKEALNRLQERFGNRLDLETFASDNPLPDSLEVELAGPEAGAALAPVLEGQAGIEEMVLPRELLERLRVITLGIQVLAFSMVALFAFSSLLIISNTIRLTVMSRQREVEIMRLVGASESLVKAPFVLEGAFLGAAGGVASALVVTLLYELYTKMVAVKLPFIPTVGGTGFVMSFWLLLTAVGIGFGLISSITAANKFLGEPYASAGGGKP